MKILGKQTRTLVLTAAALLSLPVAAGGLGGTLGGNLGGSLGGSLEMGGAPGGTGGGSEAGLGRHAFGGVREGLGSGSRVARGAATHAQDRAGATRERADAAADRSRAKADRLAETARRDRELAVDADAPTHLRASRSGGVQGATAPTGSGRLVPVAPQGEPVNATPAAPEAAASEGAAPATAAK